MPQTKNLGLPLWGETPPEGATGLDLRNAILGENEDSMAQLLDAQVERLANKITEISDEVTDEQYPSASAVKKYVDENSGAGSWNDLTDRPGGYVEAPTVVYTFDGALDDEEHIVIEDQTNDDGSSSYIAYVRAGDPVPLERLYNSTVILVNNGVELSMTISQEDVDAFELVNSEYGFYASDTGILASKDTPYSAVGLDRDGYIQAGLYTVYMRYCDADGNVTEEMYFKEITLPAVETIVKWPKEFLDVEGLPETTADDNGKVLTVVDGAWVAQAPASGLPEVTTADAGKFLRVGSDGVWAAETIPNAEEASF